MHPARIALAAIFVGIAVGAANAQIPLSPYASTFTGTAATRGYFFQTNIPMTVTGLQVPDERNIGMQVVALYKMAAAPPQYSASVPLTPVFYGQVTNPDIIPVVPPVTFQPGDWVGVLGAAGAPNGTLYNSYGTGNFTSRVLGQPITLLRMLMQANIGNTQGVGNVSAEGTAQIARVRMFVAGQGAAVRYGTSSGTGSLNVSDPFPPSIGFNGELLVVPGSTTNTGGVLLLGVTRGSLAIPPFGQLLVGLPILAILPVPGPIPAAGTPVTLAVPNDPGLLNGVVTFQAGIVDAGALTLTNGLQWTVGL